MEKKDNNSKRFLILAIETVIVLAAYFILFLGYRYSVITLVAINVPLIYMASRNNAVYGGVIYAVAMGISVAFDLWWGVFAVYFTFIPFIVTTVCIRKKVSFWSSMMLIFVIELVLVGGFLLYANYYVDNNLARFLSESLIELAKNDVIMTSFLYTLITTVSGTGDILKLAMTVTYQSMYELVVSETGIGILNSLINSIIPQLLSMVVFYSSMFNFILSRLLVKWRGGKVVEIPRIENWEIQKPHNIYISLFYLAALIGIMVSDGTIGYAAMIVYYVFSYPLKLMGTCAVAYFLKIWIKNYKGRIAISVVLYFLIPEAMVFFGVIDSLIGLRRKLKFVKIEKK